VTPSTQRPAAPLCGVNADSDTSPRPPSVQAALAAMLEEQSGLGDDGRMTFDDFKLLMLRAGREEDPNQQAKRSPRPFRPPPSPRTHTHTIGLRIIAGCRARPPHYLPLTHTERSFHVACPAFILLRLILPALTPLPAGHRRLHPQDVVSSRAQARRVGRQRPTPIPKLEGAQMTLHTRTHYLHTHPLRYPNSKVRSERSLHSPNHTHPAPCLPSPTHRTHPPHTDMRNEEPAPTRQHTFLHAHTRPLSLPLSLSPLPPP
jgi:hypothetical protein